MARLAVLRLVWGQVSVVRQPARAQEGQLGFVLACATYCGRHARGRSKAGAGAVGERVGNGNARTAQGRFAPTKRIVPMSRKPESGESR